jgi:recombinational DNA repair protein (RecF pathway)
MPPSHSPALILSRVNVKQDRIITVLSRDDGRFSAVARRARQIRKKNGLHVEPLSLCELTYQLRDDRELVRLTEAVSIESFCGIKQDLVRTVMATVMAEILLQFTVDRAPNGALFDLGCKAWGLLNNLEKEVDPSHLLLFELRVLQISGCLPPLETFLGDLPGTLDVLNAWLVGKWLRLDPHAVDRAMTRVERQLQEVTGKALKSRPFLNEVMAS